MRSISKKSLLSLDDSLGVEHRFLVLNKATKLCQSLHLVGGDFLLKIQ